MKRRDYRKILTAALFAVYAAALFYILLCRRKYSLYGSYSELLRASTNLRPFRSIREQLGRIHNGIGLRSWAIVNLLANAIAFIPLGVGLPVLWKRFRAFWRTAGFSLALIVCVETVQLVTLRGSFDVDDILLNFVGVCTGYLIFKIFRRFLCPEDSPSAK